MNDERPASATEIEGQAKEVASGDNGPKETLSSRENASEPKRQNPRELDDARYAALLSRAHSDQATALVDTVADLVAGHELAAGTRTNKRHKKRVALRATVERLLADLIQAQLSEKANGYIYRSMRPAAFSQGGVSYRVFKSVVDALAELKLLEVNKGFQTWGNPFGKRVPMIQKATRSRASQALLDLCDRHGVHVADFHQHFLIPLPDDPLILHASSRRTEYGTKIPGKPMSFEQTPHTDRLEEELKRLNQFLDGFELSGGIHRGYIRVFNNGDYPNFNWNMGGRLYSYGEANYQQMESADRLKMTIKGEAVCEIDIRASYLTIFHALHGQTLDPDSDPYDVPGLGPEARDVVKMWVTASFGNNAPIARWPRELVAKYRERTGRSLGKRYSASKVGEKVMQRLPLLARLSDPTRSEEYGWARLMFVESQAIFATMIELMEEEMPSLAVHDSVIVPLWGRQKAIKVLTKHYKAVAKVTPVLKTKTPEGYSEDPWNF